MRFRVLVEPPLLKLILLAGTDHVNAAANAIVPPRLLVVASDYRRMHPRCRNPGAHEDANAEIGVPPHLCTGRRGTFGEGRVCVRLRWGEGAGCGCCVVFFVALDLLFAVIVFAL